MLLIPAIDLKEGRCVRLKQGLMEQATVFPIRRQRWLCIGATKAHAVCIWLI